MKRYGKLVTAVGILALSFLTFTNICAGQDSYPNRPITMIVPNAAGGSMDLTARAISEEAGKILGQTIAVVNRGGAGGTLGLSALHQARGDGGYTLGGVSSSAIVRASNMTKVNYDPIKDFRPIMSYASFNIGLCVLADAQWKNLDEFLKYSKAHPGMNFSSSGAGNVGSVTLFWLARREKIDWREVPYKGGAPALTALLGKHVDFHAGVGSHIPMVRAKKFKMLAVFNPTRMEEFPEVPTLKELGYDFHVSADMMIMAPASIPQPVFDKLQAAFLQAANGPVFKDMVKKLDLEVIIKKADQMKRELILENANMIKLFTEMGILKK